MSMERKAVASECEHCDCYMADYYCCNCGALREEEEKEEEPDGQETG